MEAVRLAERREGLYGQRTRPNDLLAAIAILCMYELMDAPGPEWKAHLSALPLLDTASCSILTTQTSISAQGISAKRSISGALLDKTAWPHVSSSWPHSSPSINVDSHQCNSVAS